MPRLSGYTVVVGRTFVAVFAVYRDAPIVSAFEPLGTLVVVEHAVGRRAAVLVDVRVGSSGVADLVVGAFVAVLTRDRRAVSILLTFPVRRAIALLTGSIALRTFDRIAAARRVKRSPTHFVSLRAVVVALAEYVALRRAVHGTGV
jgi:hypothetical protein